MHTFRKNASCAWASMRLHIAVVDSAPRSGVGAILKCWYTSSLRRVNVPAAPWKCLHAALSPSSESKFCDFAIWHWRAPMLKRRQHLSNAMSTAVCFLAPERKPPTLKESCQVNFIRIYGKGELECRESI